MSGIIIIIIIGPCCAMQRIRMLGMVYDYRKFASLKQVRKKGSKERKEEI